MNGVCYGIMAHINYSVFYVSFKTMQSYYSDSHVKFLIDFPRVDLNDELKRNRRDKIIL